MNLTNNDLLLADTLKSLEFSDLEILFSFILIKQEKSDVVKILRYIEFKKQDNGEFTIIDLLCFIDHAGRDKERFMPEYSYIKYIGESTDELKRNTIYQLEYITGIDKNTVRLKNELKRSKNYKLNNFIPLIETNIIYTGDSNPNLVKNDEYEVIKKDGIEYVLSNDERVIMFEAEATDFKEYIENKELYEFDYSEGLMLLKIAFEFGKVMELFQVLSNNVLYVSHSNKREIKLKSKRTICNHIKSCAKMIINSNAMIKADFISIDEIDDIDKSNGFNVGDFSLLLTYSDGFKQVIRLEVNETSIKEIHLYDKAPKAYSIEHIDIKANFANNDIEQFKNGYLS